MKTLMKCMLMLPLLMLCSCGTWYQATLNSRGITPELKSYFITSSDSITAKSLEFKEYAASLKNRLDEVGYVEANPNAASLTIVLDYQLGDSYLASTLVGSNTYSYANIKTTGSSTSSSTANAKIKTNSNSVTANASGKATTNATVKSTGYSTSSTSTNSINQYKFPLIVSISAIDNDNNETYWEVVVKDDLDRETQMQSVMPWLILSAQPYFGKSSNGEIRTKVNNTKDIKEKYNLIWPY